MAQQNRPNRLVQMKSQEDLIQRKKLEILERQRNQELVKKLAAAQAQLGTGVETSTSLKDNTMNTFSNDGSFLENFKKISEQVQQKIASSSEEKPMIEIIPVQQQQQQQQQHQPPPPHQLPEVIPPPPQFIPPYGLAFQPQPSPQVFYNPNVPPPLPSIAAEVTQVRIGPPNVSIPPPPAPPAIPIINQDVLDIRNAKDDEKLPTTLSELIDLVATIGDIYEEKICLRKIGVPSSFWFLLKHDSPEYKRYREMVTARRKPDEGQFDPVKHFEETESVLQQQPKMVYASIDKSDSSDSDTEYMRGQMERNLKSLKVKALHPNNARKKNADSTDSDEDTDPTNEDSRGSMKRESDEPAPNQPRVKKSRWGEKVTINIPSPPPATPRLSTVKRTDLALLKYATENFGSVNLTEEDWKKAEEAYKVHLLYQDMLRKRQEIDQLARSGKFKYEYDSDEDLNGGTWEHKLRMQEMEATQLWAEALNAQAEGKHHIGDFLPPEELKKFMEKYDAEKSQKPADLSDYKEFKLREDNVGFQMLQKLGWKEGQGLGAGGSGILEPVNKASQRAQNQGLGADQDAPQPQNDDEYDAYRKRMMLAYRFRPNPLNNPRRAYY